MSSISQSDGSAQDPVQVKLDLPRAVAEHYEQATADGVYLSVEEGLRMAVIASWRFDTGSHHRVRIELGSDDETPVGDSSPDPDPAAQA